MAFCPNLWPWSNLDLLECNDIVCLKIPAVLSQLSFLQVQECVMLELIESDAPNLSLFCYTGRPIHISLGYPLQLRHIQMSSSESNMLYCASTELPSVAPNLQTLFLTSHYEVSVCFYILIFRTLLQNARTIYVIPIPLMPN